MSAIFDFSSLITVLLLSICTTTYLRELRPTIFDGSPPATTSTDAASQQQQPLHYKQREGILGFLWKLSRIGERLSPYIGIACVLQAINVLFFK